MVAKLSRGVINNLEGVRMLQERPPNMLDYLLIERDVAGYGGIPVDKNDYIALIQHPGLTTPFVTELINLGDSGAQKAEDALVQENVLYAVENSPAYQIKYSEALGIDSKDGLVEWINGEIITADDLNKLPALTNTDLKTHKEGTSYWYVPNKPGGRIYETGGTTSGKMPSKIPYSNIDDEVATIVLCAGLVKYAEVKEGQKALILAPAYPHAFGPKLEDGLERLGVECHWKHFSPQTSEAILNKIGDVNPDLLVGAPHGPKGAMAALDVLKATDDSLGTEIFPTYLEGKTIMSGGAPISMEFLSELYDEVGVNRVINEYGSAQKMGYSGKAETNGRTKGYSANVEIPPGYWAVHTIKDQNTPGCFSRGLFTVLGREKMPIVNYDPNDNLKRNGRVLEDVCRVEWFKIDEAGNWTVEIPVNAGTCVSGV